MRDIIFVAPVRRGRIELRRPVMAVANTGTIDRDQAARRYALDAAIGRAPDFAAIERQKIRERAFVELARHIGKRKQRAKPAGEEQGLLGMVEEQSLVAETVAAERQPLFLRAPMREGKGAEAAGDTVAAPALEDLQQQRRVGHACKLGFRQPQRICELRTIVEACDGGEEGAPVLPAEQAALSVDEERILKSRGHPQRLPGSAFSAPKLVLVLPADWASIAMNDPTECFHPQEA